MATGSMEKLVRQMKASEEPCAQPRLGLVCAFVIRGPSPSEVRQRRLFQQQARQLRVNIW